MSKTREIYLPTGARWLLGAIFVVFGSNGFLHFMPMPAMPQAAETFMGALAATGYMLPLIKGVEIVGGLMLITGRFVPLALALLAPGIVNIAMFHTFLAPSGLPLALGLLALSLYLAWSYRDVYRPMLTPRAIPTARKRPEQRYQFDRGARAAA